MWILAIIVIVGGIYQLIHSSNKDKRNIAAARKRGKEEAKKFIGSLSPKEKIDKHFAQTEKVIENLVMELAILTQYVNLTEEAINEYLGFFADSRSKITEAHRNILCCLAASDTSAAKEELKYFEQQVVSDLADCYWTVMNLIEDSKFYTKCSPFDTEQMRQLKNETAVLLFEKLPKTYEITYNTL